MGYSDLVSPSQIRPVEGRFPGPRDVWGAAIAKKTEQSVLDGYLSSSMYKIHFPGELTKGNLSPCFLPLDAFGISISSHME